METPSEIQPETQADTPAPYKRKTLIVNRKLQFTIMAYMTAVAAMSSLITSMSSQVIANYALTHGPTTTLVLLVSFYFVAIAGWAGIMLVFSNRVFGPIYRLHREIKNWREGNQVQLIHLRKGDHLTELIADFNEVAGSFAPKVTPLPESKEALS